MKNTNFPSAVAALALATALAAVSSTVYANSRNYEGVDIGAAVTSQHYVAIPQSPVDTPTNARNYVGHDSMALVQEPKPHSDARQARHTNNRAYGGLSATPDQVNPQERQSSLNQDNQQNRVADDRGTTAKADVSDTYDQGSVENAAQIEAQTKRQAWF